MAVVVGLVVGGWTTPARAHANLLSTTPADGEVVDAAPTEVTLTFSENVTVQNDGIRVLDAEGQRVDAGTAAASGPVVTAPVESLDDGGYVVAWRVVSADGHPIRGAFTFSVGQATDLQAGLADQAFEGGDDSLNEGLGRALRGLTYAGVLVVSGLALVGTSLRRSGEDPPIAGVATVVVVLALAAAVLQVPVQAALVTGRGWGSLTDAGVFGLVMSDGMGLSIGMLVGGLIALLLTSGLPMVSTVRALTYGGAIVAPLGFVVHGHTRTMSPAALGYLADAVHVMAAAIWLGGLVALATVVHRRRRADDPTGAGEAVVTFSRWAFWSALAVVVAGLVLSWITVGGPDVLTSTSYGQLLLAKVAVVALVMAGAAWNRYRFVPMLASLQHPPVDREVEHDRQSDDAAPTASAWGRFGTVVRLEVVGLVVVLAITGVLANVTPASEARSTGPVGVTVDFGEEGTMEVVVDPARVGRNDIHVYLKEASGDFDDRFDEAVFRLELPSQDVGPLDREPVRAGPGHFQVVSTPIDVPGEWRLTVLVRPDRFTEISASADFEVN